MWPSCRRRSPGSTPRQSPVPSATSCNVCNGMAISTSMSPSRNPSSTLSGWPVRASTAPAGSSPIQSMSGSDDGT
jgi:hypothetical protein